MARHGLFHYVKAAFKVPYNMILLGGALVAGLISTRPDVVWPMVFALEVLYLAALAQNRRFQNVIDGLGMKPPDQAAEAARAANRVVAELDPERRARYQAVRDRCLELRQRGGARSGDVGGLLQGQQDQAVNKLLWVFLRTLAHEQRLADFVATTPRREIEETLAHTEQLAASADSDDRMRKAYQENVEVLRQRLHNLDLAEANRRNIAARLVRVENSVLLIQEQALTRQEPGFIEAEVRAVTEGLSSMEELMQGVDLPEIDSLMGEQAPSLLESGQFEEPPIQPPAPPAQRRRQKQ